MKKLVFQITLVLLFLIASKSSIAQTNPTGLKKGEKAPDFAAKDQLENKFLLSEKLKSGPVVLVFYRGQWCPYCNKYLNTLEKSLSELKSKGVAVVAITPETLEGIKQTIEKTKVSFPVIYDDSLKIMNKYKVSYAIDEKTVKAYKGYGIDFNKVNGANGAYLPVPATYIIGKDGIIKYVVFNPDYTKRPPIEEIMSNL